MAAASISQEQAAVTLAGWPRQAYILPMKSSPRATRILSLVAFPAFLAAIVAALLLFRQPLLSLFRSPENLRAWVEARGAWAALAFMGLQALQVVVFVLPGEIVQIGGGFAFGLWMGSLWSVLGILAGSLVNFAMGRWLGRPFAEQLLGKDKVERVERATAGGKAAAAFFVLFAIPGLPKDALTYVAGASRLGFLNFLAVSTLGRLPGILGSSFMGAAAFERDYRAAIIVAVGASVLFCAGLFFRERIHDALARLAARRRKPDPGPPAGISDGRS